MSELSLSHEISPSGICTIVAAGVLDAHTSGQLDALVSKVMTGGCHKIICDIEKVTYIASAGVGVFIGSVETCRQKGGNLVLVYSLGFDGQQGSVGLTPGFNVLEVFNLLGLSQFISVATTQDEATRLFG